MALGMRSTNKGQNIKRAKVSKPKNNFNSIKKNKKHKWEKISSVKIYSDTLTKVRFIQHVLGCNTHEQVLQRLIDKDLPKICKSYHISKKDAKIGLKYLNRKL